MSVESNQLYHAECSIHHNVPGTRFRCVLVLSHVRAHVTSTSTRLDGPRQTRRTRSMLLFCCPCCCCGWHRGKRRGFLRNEQWDQNRNQNKGQPTTKTKTTIQSLVGQISTTILNAYYVYVCTFHDELDCFLFGECSSL